MTLPVLQVREWSSTTPDTPGSGALLRDVRLSAADRELIEESERRPAPDLDDERRRYYRITRFGHRVALAEAARLHSVVAEAKRKLARNQG